MRKVVAGNWKMNHGMAATRGFLDRLDLADSELEAVLVLLFPPAISIGVARGALRPGSQIRLGVQNVHEAEHGAFTGETSAEMAVEAGAAYALVGHSERRHLFGETGPDTLRKVAAARRAGLVPVLCVGETLVERQAGRLATVIVEQLDAVLGDEREAGSVERGDPFLLAYEPVWAIGTGETATPADASEAHGILRLHLEERIGVDRARAISILYGGSVSPENAGELLRAPDVDGVLVGGASLDPGSFARIVRAAGDGSV
ncbi:MAG: triose-phosphate isomerase [Gemmatimonadota bacterium]